MRNQHMRNEARSFRTFKLATVVLMLVALACCFTVFASALLTPDLTLNEHYAIDMEYSQGVPSKEYDGTDAANVTLTDAGKAALEAMLDTADKALVKFECTAKFNSANVADAKNITVTVTAVAANSSPEALAAAAKYQALMPAPQSIPAKITPKTLEWNYANGVPTIKDVTYVMGQTEYSAKLAASAFPALNATAAPNVAVTEVMATVTGVTAPVGKTTYNTTVRVALDSTNYVAAPLNVAVEIAPIQIVSIAWSNDYNFAWGDAAAFAVSAVGVDANGNSYPLNVTFPDGYGNAGTYDNVKAVATAGLEIAGNVSATRSITIQKRVFTVSMDSATYLGNADSQANPNVYSLAVKGELPADVRAQITYANNAKSAYGSYTVLATLPESTNYSFVDASGNAVTTLQATLEIRKTFIAASNEDLPYQIILSRPEGFLNELQAVLTIPADLANDAVKGFPFYKAYTLAITGGEDATVTVTIPFAAELFQKNCKALSVGDLYLYDNVSGKLVPVTELAGYTVTVGDSYFQVEGVEGDSTMTFVLAPVYQAPFWGSVWSILLIVFIVLAVIALMMLIGLYLLRIRDKEEETVIDTEGDVPAVVEPEVEDTVDVEEALDQQIEEIVEETEPAAEEEAVAEEVEEAVAEAMAENLNESADAAEAIALVEEDSDDDEDEEEDEDSFAGFGSMPLEFIDAIAEADKYAEMLEQERRGEVRLVTRYRRSYESRLAQSQGNVQEYYNIIKNLLLAYKGVKNRISWNYEAFNRGRVHVAKINAKTKTLYLYLALNPEELVDTKYGVIDMSSKKKYATVPALMKIKGDRKFKYALELIAKVCGENMELPLREVEEIDFKVPYQTTEELVAAGLVKKLVASVPVVYSEAPVLEEAAAPVTPATEDQEVTFVAPTDDAAVAAAAEEIASEEETKEV